MTDNIVRDLFASHREPAWHGLGTVFDHEVTDSREMLALAGLDNWNVRSADIAPVTEEGQPIDARFIQNMKAIMGTVAGEEVVLGVTGERYEIIQNEDAFSFLQTLHDGARWETAGAIKGGRVVFGSMAFDRDFILDETGVADKVNSYLLVHTSHDGSTGLAGGITPVRVVCQNTLNVAKKGMKQSFKMRHTATVEARMKAEAEMWRQANTYMDAFEEQARTLFETPATDKEFFSIVEEMFPRPEVDIKGSLTKWENKMSTFTQAWKGEPNAGIKNTAWGVFNALTEGNQWGRNVRNTENGSENFFSAGAGFDIPTNKFRQDALSASLSLV